MRLRNFICRDGFWNSGSTDNNICAAAVALSVLFSLWVSFYGGIINLDGILYVSVAERLAHGDLNGASRLYNWFFYSLCIAGVSKVSGLALETSAYLLTAFFSALLTCAFLACVRVLGGDRKTLLWAAFVIVLHPVFMSARSEIIRDHGYWSFYLFSILFFLRFYEKQTWCQALLWGGSMVLATLFRIEGLLFLLLLPTVFLFRGEFVWSRRISCFIRAHMVSLFLLLIVAVIKISDPSFDLLQHGRLGDAFVWGEKLYFAFTGGLAGKAAVLEKLVLNPYSEKYAMPVLVMIPFMILAHKLVLTLTPLYTCLLAWHPLRSARFLNRVQVPVLVWLALLNVVMLIAILFADYFMPRRFVFPLGLILLLPLPFILNRHFTRWSAAKRNSVKIGWLIYPVFMVLLLQSLDGLVTMPGSSSSYIKDAGLWLKQNISAQATLYSNNPKIYYYSGHMAGYWENRPARIDLSSELLEKKPWQSKAYIALWSSHHSARRADDVTSAVGSQPIKTFRNSRNDAVLIYAAR
ncbi:MAG: hypothetical protein JXR80_05335 [Deltaproteobacteria bacterium]|nr:hypothetical protein [Deltaproteobacteria bacterium]